MSLTSVNAIQNWFWFVLPSHLIPEMHLSWHPDVCPCYINDATIHVWQDKLPLTYSVILFINTLRPRQNGHRFADDTFKRIFLNENVRISIKISLMFVPKVRINNIPALVQIMAWCRPGDKPLSELMLVIVPTHKCVTRPQWVKL